MKRFWVLGIVSLAALSGLSLYRGIGFLTSARQESAVVEEEKDESRRRVLLERGREIFNQRCASCHGVDGQNPKSPETDFGRMTHLSYAQIFKSTKGRVKESEDDARAVAHFIKTLTESSKQDSNPPEGR